MEKKHSFLHFKESYKNPFLFVVIVTVFCIMLVDVFLLHEYQKKPRQVAKLRNVPVADEHITLSITPLTKKVRAEDRFAIDIYAKGTKEILAIDLSLLFDPKNLSVESIAPGSYFINPMVFSKMVNQSDGSIFYALGSLHPSSTHGTLITLIFKAKNAADASFLTIEPKTIASVRGGKPGVITIQEKGIYTIVKR